MFKRTAICQAVALALALPSLAMAADSDESYLDQVSVSGYLKNETAIFTRDGQPTGMARSMLDDRGYDSGDIFKFENSARAFLTGPLGEQTSWTADLMLIYEATGNLDRNYKGHQIYSQQDWLRELYVDTALADWQFRVGKQQVVWGTADGIKLLDIINPTDYREFNQNTFEDSRIPVWMVKAEKNLGDVGSMQFILSQAEANKIPGLDTQDNHGEVFIMKGVDAITGPVNGFVNITPALGATAQSFTNAALGGAFTGGPGTNPGGLVPFAGLTVDAFASGYWDPVSSPGQILPATPATGVPGFMLLNNIAQCGLMGCGVDPNANNYVTNLMPVTGTGFMDTSWRVGKSRTSAFEHMPNATFATFNSFSGVGFTGSSARSVYERDYPDDANPNIGFRWKSTTSGGFSYSLNYLYNYDPNPYIDLAWHDANTGEKLNVQRAASMPVGGGAFAPDLTSNRSRSQIQRNLATNPVDTTSVLLRNSAGQYYGAVDPTFGMMPGAYTTDPVELRFTEKLNRVHNIGASFDYALDTEALGAIVLRGEFLYQKDTKQPVVDNLLLGIGDLANGLEMEDADVFKYVLGADITVLTNLMISGQFIQFRNLDYVDKGGSCTTQTGISFDCSRYTGDFPVMNPTNGMVKARENKEFYSLFFSKPFGDSQEHRWNNITIYEEGGGYWNRFDVEYSFTDNLIGTAEWNSYWGDRNTLFGQFKDSSNLQVGIKYLF
jgi:hypothetical protein